MTGEACYERTNITLPRAVKAVVFQLTKSNRPEKFISSSDALKSV
jgi:hypothetical protein